MASRLPVWSLEFLAVVICLDLTQAWSALSVLKEWIRVADRIVLQLLERQPPQKQQELKNKSNEDKQIDRGMEERDAAFLKDICGCPPRSPLSSLSL